MRVVLCDPMLYLYERRSLIKRDTLRSRLCRTFLPRLLFTIWPPNFTDYVYSKLIYICYKPIEYKLIAYAGIKYELLVIFTCHISLI